MYRLMQPSDRAEILALWQREHGEDETFLANAIERFAGEQNVYVAEENDHIEAVAMAVPVSLQAARLLPVRPDRAGQPDPGGPGRPPVHPAETERGWVRGRCAQRE